MRFRWRQVGLHGLIVSDIIDDDQYLPVRPVVPAVADLSGQVQILRDGQVELSPCKGDDLGADILFSGAQPAEATGVGTLAVVMPGILQSQLGFADAAHALEGGDGQAIGWVQLLVEGVEVATDEGDGTTAGEVVGGAC